MLTWNKHTYYANIYFTFSTPLEERDTQKKRKTNDAQKDERDTHSFFVKKLLKLVRIDSALIASGQNVAPKERSRRRRV